MPLQFLLDLFQQRPVEYTTFRQADLLQTVQQFLGVEVLVALDLDTADRSPFAHEDNQHVAVAFQVHVVEKTGLEQRIDGRDAALFVQRLADLDRQVVEHRAGGYALQSLDADILDGKRREGMCGPVHQQRQQQDPARQEQTIHRHSYSHSANQSHQIVIESHRHQHEQQEDADLLPCQLRRF